MLRNSRGKHRVLSKPIVVWMIVVCVLFLQIPAFGSESATNGQTNLLVNPNWESGTEGWTSFAVDEPDIFHGETVQCSSIGQDISLEPVTKAEFDRIRNTYAPLKLDWKPVAEYPLP